VNGVSPTKLAMLQGTQPTERAASPPSDEEWMLAPKGIAAAALLALPLWVIAIVVGLWLLR
jgi:hypothetical protein